MMAVAADNKDAAVVADEDNDGDSAAKDGSSGWWRQREHPRKTMMTAMAAMDGCGKEGSGRGGQ